MNTTTSHQGRLKSLRAAGIGNAFEWFDWTLSATFSVYLASNLFDKTDARSANRSTQTVRPVDCKFSQWAGRPMPSMAGPRRPIHSCSVMAMPGFGLPSWRPTSATPASICIAVGPA